MDANNLFYGFRGSITFPEQSNIYNYNLENNSKSKNKIFRDFFEMIEKTKKYESLYQNRVYYLIFKNIYGDLLHCQLARKKQFNKRVLIENNIIESEDDDYPYVNVFVDLVGQKFLIESNTQVFENYNTCGTVLENIINNNLREKDIVICLNQIVEEESFWNYFSNEEKIYNIEFRLTAPNMFDAEDDATIFLKEAEKNVGSNILNINFCNSEGKLKPNRIGIDSFIKYISAGGGSWKITRLGPNGKKEKISSQQKSTKVIVPISYDDLKNKSLTEEQINEVLKQFRMIETIEKFKEEI
jgi:hypothetical protein